MNDTKWLLDSLNKIEKKVDIIDEKLDTVNIKQEKNMVVLEEHQRRSIANEQSVEVLKEELRIRIQPVETYLIRVNTVFKIIGFISVGIGIIAGIAKSIYYFSRIFS